LITKISFAFLFFFYLKKCLDPLPHQQSYKIVIALIFFSLIKKIYVAKKIIITDRLNDHILLVYIQGTGLSYIFIYEIGNVKLDCHVYDLIV
jgi:hypothetical protein